LIFKNKRLFLLNIIVVT